MEDLELDLDNVFVRNIAIGLGIDLNHEILDTEDFVRLQGSISSCVICYYFAKTHFLVLEDIIKRVCYQKSGRREVRENEIRGCVSTWLKEKEETGEVHDFKRCISNLGVFDQNFDEFQDCMDQIDMEFEKNQDYIQCTTHIPVLKLEDEIASRKSVQNYITPEKNLERVSDYYTLKDVGIESYLETRCAKEYQPEIIYIK